MRKSKAIVVRPEVLTPVPEDRLAQLVEAKLAEIMEKTSNDAIFAPFFHTQAISNEIKRRQTVPEQMKWSLYYAKWGCLLCGTKDARHEAVGMCRDCHRRIMWRLRDILRQAQNEQEARGVPVIRDLVEEARNAIGIKDARRALLARRD